MFPNCVDLIVYKMVILLFKDEKIAAHSTRHRNRNQDLTFQFDFVLVALSLSR